MSRVYPSDAQPRGVRRVGWADGNAELSEVEQPDWAISGAEQEVRVYRFPRIGGEPEPEPEIDEPSPSEQAEAVSQAEDSEPDARLDEAESPGSAAAPAPAPEAEAEPEPTAEALAEEAREKGWAEGYAQGEQAARTHFSKLAGAVTSLEQLGSSLHEQLGEAVIQLACRIVSHVLEAQVEAAPELLVESVRRAVHSLEGAESVTIRMHPEDIGLLEAADASTTFAVSGVLQMSLHADASMQRGGFVIDSNVGGVDGALGRRLAVIEEQLMALDDGSLLEELLSKQVQASSPSVVEPPVESELSEAADQGLAPSAASESSSDEEADD